MLRAGVRRIRSLVTVPILTVSFVFLVGAVAVAGCAFGATSSGPAYEPLEDGHYDGAPDPVDGVDGQGVVLEANTDAYVASDSSADDGVANGNYTIAGWINLHDRSGMQYLVGDHGYKYSNPAIYVYEDGTPEFRVHWNRDSTDTSIAATGEAESIDAGSWHHLVGRIDSTGEETTITLFVNGRAVASASMADEIDHTERIDVGRGIWNHDEVYTTGTVSDVHLYDRSLSDPEIRALYTSGTSDSLWRCAYASDGLLPALIGGMAVLLAGFERRVRS